MRLLFLICFANAAIFSMGQPVNRGLNPTNNKESAGVEVIGTNYAVVVGISKYAQIQNLLYADDDAALFSEYLRSQGVCQRNNMAVLIDSTATTANFYKELNLIRNRIQPKDRVILYFAGHGDVETDLESGFLLSFNTEKSNYAATSIDINMLQRYVDAFINKGASVILITDACRSGNLAGGLAGTTSTLNSLKQGFNNCTKILSCQPNQLSLEKRYADGGHGVFTYHLVNALNGLADRNNDRTVTLRELDVYLDSVATETDQRQIPRVEGNPLFVVSSYKDSIRDAIAAKTNQLFNNNIVERSITNGAFDSNSVYITFMEQIKKGQLIDPPQNNAYQTIEDASKSRQAAELIQQMKIELSAVLEDEVQGYLNKILRAEYLRQGSSRHNIRKYLAFMDKCLIITNENALRFQEMRAIKTYLECRLARINGNSKEFKSLINRLISDDRFANNHALFYNEIGNLYRSLREFDKSFIFYQKAQYYSPTWIYPVANIGYNYFLMGKDSLALVYLNKALNIEPKNAWLLGAIGEVLNNQGNVEQAIVYFDEAITIDSTDIGALYSRGYIARLQNQIDLSESLLSKVIFLDSTDIDAWTGYAITKSIKGQYSDAEFAFLYALKLNPELGTSYYNLACLYSTTNRINLATSYLEKAIINGYKRFDLFEKDPDLENLRKTEGYKKLLLEHK